MRTNNKTRRIRCLLWVLALLTELPALAANPPLVVGGAACEFTDLFTAVAEAADRPGDDTIVVTRSFFNVQLQTADVGGLTIERGNHPCAVGPVPEVIALQGTNSLNQPVLRISGAGNVRLSGLRISAGSGRVLSDGRSWGGGILHQGGGTLTVEDSILTQNKAQLGGAIAVLGAGSLTLSNVRLSENQGESPHGSALQFHSSGELTVTDTLFDNNMAPAGVIDSASSVGFQDVSVSQTRGSSAALVFSGPGTAQLDGLSGSDNDGPAVSFSGSSTQSISDCVLQFNGPGSFTQGALLLSGSGSVSVSDCLITDNIMMSGIASLLTGTLEIERTEIRENSAIEGAGLRAAHDGDQWPLVRIGPDTIIAQNVASEFGGGVYLSHVALDSSNAKGHVISQNQAEYGGGLYATDRARARIGSGAESGTVVDNIAIMGGGIYLSDSAEMVLHTTDPRYPVGVSRNRAQSPYLGFGEGGAIFVDGTAGGDTRVFAYDAKFDDNAAVAGGAVALRGDQNSRLVFCLGRASSPDGCSSLDGTIPITSVSCAGDLECNTFDRNTTSGVLVGGAALLRTAQAGPVSVRIEGARIRQNSGHSIFASVRFDALSPTQQTEPVTILDSLVTDNTATSALFDGGEPIAYLVEDFFGPLAIAGSTIAQNVFGAPTITRARIGFTATESIFDQPGAPLHSGNPSGITASNLIVGSLAGLPQRPDVIAVDPLLVHAGDDLVPGAGSAALDFSSTGPTATDLRGALRGLDLPLAANRFGPRDLGAIEVQALPLFAIFRDGFE